MDVCVLYRSCCKLFACRDVEEYRVNVTWVQFMVKKHNGFLIFCAILAVLIVAGGIFLSCYNRANYVVSFPKDGRIVFEIAIDTKMYVNTGVGNEWYYNHFLNNERIYSGNKFEIGVSEGLRFTSEIIEKDEISDVGSSTSEMFCFSKGNNYSKTNHIVNEVIVWERGGRSNKGSSAKFYVTYTLERIVPDDMNFWTFLYEDDFSALAVVLTCCLGVDILALVFAFIKKMKSRGAQLGLFDET